ncbi:MAG: FecR domain-containing protein [Alphaproteobacteria bacterium]|nr:FecR domain-containing protein [Alphaproteobacteria bacterium]
MRVRLAFVLVVVAAAAVAIGGDARTAAGVGEVERTKLSVNASLGGDRRALHPAAQVFLKETVETGDAARAMLRFSDRTQVTMGEKASLLVDEFVFASGGSTVLKLVRGALRYASAAGKDPAREVRLVTSVATIGVRGTDFWVGPIEGAVGIVLLDGVVEITNAGGTVVLDEPREGTLVFGAAIAPGQPAIWPDERIARALATTGF